MPTIEGYPWTTIAASQVDADSPVDETLMGALRNNQEFVMRWLGGSYLTNAALDHDHDGANSSLVAGASGGAAIGVIMHPTHGFLLDYMFSEWVRFKPEFALVLTHTSATSQNAQSTLATGVYFKTPSLTGANMISSGISLTATAYYEFCHGGIRRRSNGISPGVVGLGYNVPHINSASTHTHGGQDLMCVQMMRSVTDLIEVGSYTGNGTSQTITVGFQPDFVLTCNVAGGTSAAVKATGFSSTGSHLISGGTHQTTAITGLTATGFTVGSHASANTNTATYDYLAFKAGGFAGEKIVRASWTGNGTSPRTISGIGFRPQMVYVIRTDNSTNTDFGVASPRTSFNTVAGSHSFDGGARDSNGIIDWDDDGFVVGSTFNTGSVTYDAYCFLGGTRFDMV